jgi:hypothetical protein
MKETNHQKISTKEEQKYMVSKALGSFKFIILTVVGAPELCRSSEFSKRSIIAVKPSIDAWSFGAVLSVTLVWCAFGKEGVDYYYKRRVKATEHIPELIIGGCEGCFHDGEQPLKVVSTMHDKVRAAFPEDDPCSYHLFSGLTVLADDLLAEADVRISDKVIDARIHSIFRVAGYAAGKQPHVPQGSRATESSSSGVAQSQPLARRNPPKLPPGMQYRNSDNDGGSGVLPSPVLVARDKGKGSLSPSIPPSQPRLPSDRINKMGDPTNGYLNPSRVSPQVSSSAIVRGSSSSTYPNVTIEATLDWVSKVKSNNHKHLFRSTSIPPLLEPEHLSQLEGRDQVISTIHRRNDIADVIAGIRIR